MCKTYGYCRISRATQNIERQERNIRAAFPDAVIIKEAYTGTKVAGRKEFEKLLRVVKDTDTIVFDSVSRMSRNAAEGIELYEELYNKGVRLVFIKEPYINTDTYKQAALENIPTVGNEIADAYIEATNKVLLILARRQIEQAFAQAQKEVDDLRQRTKEGIETARLNGKKVGAEGHHSNTRNIKKEAPAKEAIRKYSKAFDGTLGDADVIKLVGISRNTYYKYKGEMLQEAAEA